MSYEVLLFLHVIGATVLLGTGAGIAFFMVVSNHSKDPRLIAHVAGIVVLADTLFTATAAVFQPVTGYFLAKDAGWPLSEGWVALSLALYVIVGAFWLPVVWIQIKLRSLATTARDTGQKLPPAYHRLYRIWFACGFPAFAAVLTIVWLMLTKPTF
ncbi:DUF2269 domain-containing protein [Tropicibacter sp. Alg240-R139]|uniref:DUF2269 family protein n=1 Tax=Tropicibacter sp. Alg240-R139 TaxID=2305991 RepID=UPI0013DFDD84|nr:DUF2269 domain-containing protein [Tropicibacter sp. Alg240-R139]